MSPLIAKAHVDRLFAVRDLGEIYWAIGVAGKDRKLPEEFWLFCRTYEWAPARSGLWQYYEGLPREQFERVNEDLERFGLTWIAEQYRLGQRTWDGPTRAAEVERWLDAHADDVHAAVFKLIEARREHLAMGS